MKAEFPVLPVVEGAVQITQVLPPRDALSLDDFELLGFARRAQLRRFLGAHHVPVVVDGKNLRFRRDDFLAGMRRGAVVLPRRSRRTPVEDSGLVLPRSLRLRAS